VKGANNVRLHCVVRVPFIKSVKSTCQSKHVTSLPQLFSAFDVPEKLISRQEMQSFLLGHGVAWKNDLLYFLTQINFSGRMWCETVVALSVAVPCLAFVYALPYALYFDLEANVDANLSAEATAREQ